jgi:Rieske Fe-S protein
MSQTRRKFINTLIGIGGIGSLGAILYPIFSYLIPPIIAEAKVKSVKIGSISEIPPNSSKIVKYGRKPVIIVRTKDGEITALEATCTHLDCIVQFNNETNQILCACHNGIYDLKGRNVSGPPPKPLTEFEVTIIDDEIVITQPG